MSNEEYTVNTNDYNANSILEMILLISYPGEIVEGESVVECRDKFYKKENILPKLNYISEKMTEVFKNSKEEDKKYMFYILIIRMKQLYCKCQEYEKALNIKKSVVSFIFNNIIQGKCEIDEEDIPLIVNEAYARLKVNHTIDEQTYNVIKKFYEQGIDNISILSSSVYAYESNKNRIYIGYEEENLVSVLIESCKMLVSNNEGEVLKKFVFVIGELIYDSYECELNSENVKNLYKDIVDRFIELQNICKNEHKFIKKLINFYITAFEIISINAENDETVADKQNAEKLKKDFIDLIKSFNNELMEKYWNNIVKLCNKFLSFRYYIVENYKSFFLQTILELIKKKSMSNLKEKMMKGVILEFTNISGLFNIEEYKYVAQIYDMEKGKNNDRLERYYFEIAYSLDKCGRVNEGKKLYEETIQSGNAGSATYNNLGVIYENVDKDYNKALQYYEKSIKLTPDDKIAENNIKRVKSILKDLEEKPKKMKDMYFKKLKPWHRKILFAIYRLSDNDKVSLSDLSESTKQSIDSVKKNLYYLIDLGMVIENNCNFYIDSIIEELVRDYIDPKLERQIVKVDNAKLYRPIFYHESEIFMYKALLELFPQHLIFPNMSLKTIFDIDKMKEVLEAEELKYLFMAHVDFVIINTSNYFPVLAFEKDSSYNDTDYAKDRAEKKNLIFRIGGIPLIRLKFNSGIEYEKLKSDIRESTKSMILEYDKDNTYEVDFKKEFDIKKFGIVNSPIDLAIIKSDWEDTVGKGIAQKSKVIDIESGKLLIEISEELKPIIEMSEAVIKQKLYDKYDLLKEVEFIWY